MSIKVKNQAEKLYLELRRSLESVQWGKKFYSQRKIMKQFQVTRHVLDHALKRLAEEKLIELRAREGIFALNSRNSDSIRIVTVRNDWISEQLNSFDMALKELLGKDPEKYELGNAFYSFERNDYLEKLESVRADIVLLYPPYEIAKEDLKRLLSMPQTIVFCANTLKYSGVDAIDLHPELVGMTAADYLMRNGHRKLALLLSEPMHPAEEHRLSSFFYIAGLHGIDVKLIDCHVESGYHSQALAHQELSRYLKENGLDFTGLFVVSDSSALGAFKALNDFGLRIPDDVSVIGNGGAKIGEFYNPPLTTVSENFAGYAAAVKAGADDMASGKPFGLRSVMPLIIERQSVKNLNK